MESGIRALEYPNLDTILEHAKEIVDTWKYSTERVHLCPYDPEAFDEDFLVKLYRKTKDDGLMELVFPAMASTLNAFVSYLHARPMVIGCLKLPDYPVVGFGWLNEAEGYDGARKASFGFTFFRQFWGKSEIGEISKLAIRWWFTECRIDVLYGATLSFNRAARLFAIRMGFTSVGNMPGFFIRDGEMLDAHLVCLRKSDWKGNQNEIQGNG